MSSRYSTIGLTLVFALLFCAGIALAHSPSPEAKAKFIKEGTWEQKAANLRAFDASLPADMYEKARERRLSRQRQNLSLGADAVDTIRVVVLLVDFPDFHWNQSSFIKPDGGTMSTPMAATPAMFDSLLFSQRGVDQIVNPTGSMFDYYIENSYGKYFILGDVLGWFRVPNNYASYVGDNNGMSMGPTLARDAVKAADTAGVDFSPYGNGTAFVDGVIIIHAGPGAEEGAYGIWSHRAEMSFSYPIDGVWMSAYTMQPEERANQNAMVHVGVFCHEWGHVLGVPDWYDTQYNPGSEGLGRWSIMASGSWNQGGQLPSHFDAYSKFIAGFNEMVWLTENLENAPIPQAGTSPVAYAIRRNGIAGDGPPEIWFIENRQKVGFDESLPGQGLLIYHFDATGKGNTDPDRYELALEEADGRMDLRYNGSGGQSSDPFPGSWNNREFHEHTVPSSLTNDSLSSKVSVMNISDNGAMMYADLNVTYAMPYLLLAGDSLSMNDPAPYGNNDGIFEQGETIEIYLEVHNIMKMSFNPVLHVDIDNPNVTILNNDQTMGLSLNPITNQINFDPIKIQIPEEFVSSQSTMTCTVISNKVINSGDQSFHDVFEFDVTLGRAQILLVDDDNNYGNDYDFRRVLDRMGLPFRHWDKAAQGSPDYASVSEYPFVFWMTGAYWPPYVDGGTLTADDVTFMKAVLDGGGNLLLASPSAPIQLETLDPDFMANYLHAELTGSQKYRWFQGEADNRAGAGLAYTTKNGITWDEVTPTMAAINGGQRAFTLTLNGSGDYGACGITYDGDFRTAFLSFGVEFVSDSHLGQGYMPADSLIFNIMSFFQRGTATAVEEDGLTSLLPGEFSLDQNYPNPFNPATIINYSIQAGDRGHTNLAIFNVLGRQVATLVDQAQGPGNYSVRWQGRADDGSKVASGVYFYRLTQGDRTETKKMMLLK